MYSVAWTYLWTSMAAISVVVRSIVLKLNLRDRRILARPDIHASDLMRRIQAGHIRVSLVLAFISLCNTAIGVIALVTKYHGQALPYWFVQAVGYFFIGYFVLSEALLTLLAWFDLRMRGVSTGR
jgi:hypothetical protein